MRNLLLLVAILGASLVGTGPARADPGLEFGRPLDGSVVRAFEAPPHQYAAGHRGVDLAGASGAPVRSPAVGRVLFAGYVAGTGTVSIDLGNGWRTTFQPVVPTVSKGDVVRSGQMIGRLSPGHCAVSACLHWGLTDGMSYLDPTDYLRVPVIRLLPRGATPTPVRELPPARVGPGSGAPVDGRVTSAFGMRRHPVTGELKLHDGTDYAASCGTAVTAPVSGTVISSSFDGAYGYRVRIDHGGGIVMGYAHLLGLDVHAGQVLAAGEQLGRVGSTGLSTGCHLHWMAWRDGSLVDPTSLA